MSQYQKYPSNVGPAGPPGPPGGVTSVGLSAPASILAVSGSPVTSTGTLALTLVTQTANMVWAGPATGPAAAPTFRSLVAADIPALPYQPTGNYITALTGDATASGPGSAALTLATVNSSVGSFGGAASVGSFTVNAKGLITAASAVSIQIAESQVTNLVSDLAGKQPTGNYITALTGDVTASGPGSSAATIAAGVVTNSKLADMATQTFKGRNTAGTGAPEDLSIATAKTMLDLAGTNTGDQTITLTGDVTGSGTGSFAATIANNAVTNAKAAQMAANTIKGNNTGATANASDLTLSQVVGMLAPTGGNQFITSGTTFTTAANITTSTRFRFTLVGGGGGGSGKNQANSKGCGGGAGGTCIVYLSGLSPSTGYTIAIGAGGAGGISTTTAATGGGSTTLTVGATTYTANGGGVGTTTNQTNGGAGGTATNGTINITGQNGGAQGGQNADISSGAGGSSLMGLGGAPINPAGTGKAGTGYGSGGSGGSGAAATGGAGAQGCILVQWGI